MAAPIASITISLVEDSHDEVSPYDAQFVCDNGTAKSDLQGGTSKQSGRRTMKKSHFELFYYSRSDSPFYSRHVRACQHKNKGPAAQWHGIYSDGDGYAFGLNEDNGKITGTYEICDSEPAKRLDDDLFCPVTGTSQHPDVTNDGLTL